MHLTETEKRLFEEEARDYAKLLATIAKPKRKAHVPGVEIVGIGNTGGAASVVGGRPCGGFLIRAQGRTVIVDPGEAAMTWLVQRGFDPYEITDVIATHAHNDHVGQLSEAVSAAVNLGLGPAGDGKVVVVPALVDYDEPAATRYGFTLPAYAWSADVVPLYWRDAEATRFDGRTIRSRAMTELAPGFTVRATEARHGPVMVTGLVFDTPIGRIGYSGDTEYFPGLADWLRGSDLLWLNMSTLGVDPTREGPILRDAAPVHVHLGYVGVVKLIDEVRPKTAIVSHLGAQLAERRAQIETTLQARFAPEGIRVICPQNGDSFHFVESLAAPPRCEEFKP